MYGLATDDSHSYHKKGKKWSNAGRGWVMVQSDTLSANALIESMEAGQFYGSTGVTMKEVNYQDNKLSVAVDAEQGVTYTIVFIGCKKGESETSIFKSIVGNEASVDLTDDILFMRCKITSSKLQYNPIEDILYETAWTQPVLPAN